MIVLLFDEYGLAGLRLPENLSAQSLLGKRELLERLAPDLQKLDSKIKRLRGENER